MAEATCIRPGDYQKGNENFEKSIEEALSTKDNPIDIPDGSTICLNGDGIVSSYKVVTNNDYAYNTILNHYSPDGDGITKKIERSHQHSIFRDGEVVHVTQTTRHRVTEVKAEGDFEKAGTLIYFKGLVQGLVNFLN